MREARNRIDGGKERQISYQAFENTEDECNESKSPSREGAGMMNAMAARWLRAYSN